MKNIKLTKFTWNRNNGKNLGHDNYEWGKQKEIVKTSIVEEYDLIKNSNKKNECILCGQNYKFIGSKFCSKKCYKYYFYPKFN